MTKQTVTIFFFVMSRTVHASLQTIPHYYPLMHYTSLIGEETFTPGLVTK